jgi:hypothetical protein
MVRLRAEQSLRTHFQTQAAHGLMQLQRANGIGDFLGGVLKAAGNFIVRLIVTVESKDGDAIARLLGGIRRPLTTAITTFFGDVFKYQTRRYAVDPLTKQVNPNTPGPIPKTFLDALLPAAVEANQKNEKLVVVSHSMGGQIVYDAVTHFMRKDSRFKDVVIDVWVAAACQCAVFEEMKILSESVTKYNLKTGKVPNPTTLGHLRHWTAVWDPTDILSFTSKAVFDRVDDQFFISGLSPLEAHGGYLQSPEFYQRIANLVRGQAWTASVE